MCVKMCICLFILLQTYFQFRQLPCSAAARQLCQMQRICLAATLVQGCHNEAKAFFGAVFKLKPQHHLSSELLQCWPCYLGVGGSSPGAETFACLSVHLFVHFTANIFPILTTPLQRGTATLSDATNMFSCNFSSRVSE